MHPLGEIVEILAVAIPFQPLVEGFPGATFGKFFPDPQPALGRMRLACGFAQATDPTGPPIIAPMMPNSAPPRSVLPA